MKQILQGAIISLALSAAALLAVGSVYYVFAL